MATRDNYANPITGDYYEAWHTVNFNRDIDTLDFNEFTDQK